MLNNLRKMGNHHDETQHDFNIENVTPFHCLDSIPIEALVGGLSYTAIYLCIIKQF